MKVYIVPESRIAHLSEDCPYLNRVGKYYAPIEFDADRAGKKVVVLEVQHQNSRLADICSFCLRNEKK